VFGEDPGGEKIRYLIVGGLTTLVNFSIFVLMHELCGIDETISNLVSIPASILFAYIANKLVVFRQQSESIKYLALEFIKFVGSRLFTMALEVGIVFLFSNVLEWNATLGKVIAMIVVIILNYVISKVIVFR
jgi:putative flippase GtrA